MEHGKFVQIVFQDTWLFALDEDGIIWRKVWTPPDNDEKWIQVSTRREQ